MSITLVISVHQILARVNQCDVIMIFTCNLWLAKKEIKTLAPKLLNLVKYVVIRLCFYIYLSIHPCMNTILIITRNKLEKLIQN